jgi:protein-tyrosine phosphatase
MTNYHVKTEHMSMIDLHLHLLPGIDDGAASLDVSSGMLAEAQANGFGTLVATPHLSGVLTSQFRQQVDEAFAAVRELAGPFGIEVLLGFEVLLTPDLPRRLAQGERVTLAGSRAILVELPFTLWPSHTEQTLFDLQVAGYRPLLAHPERYHAVQEDPERAINAVERGAVLQITIGSLTGMFGRTARKTAEHLLESVDSVVVATDAHSAGKRLAAVEEGMQRLRHLVGDSFARACIVDGPRALLTDAPMPSRIDRESTEQSVGWGDRLRRMFKSS